MHDALHRLQTASEQPSDMPNEMVAFGISGELKHSMAGLFMSHPPLEARMQALKDRYQN